MDNCMRYGFPEFTPARLLDEVNKAIYHVLNGGQSYTIGSRSMTRADLAKLWDMRSALIAEINADADSGFLDNTFVGVFCGR